MGFNLKAPTPSIPSLVPNLKQGLDSAIDRAKSLVAGVLGSVNGVAAATEPDEVSPWDKFAPHLGAAFSSYFWANYDIEAADFNQDYGYQLVIHGDGIRMRRLSFPINPTNIDIQVPVAVTNTVTMRGVVEDYNGAPLRRISIRGVAGILPNVGKTSPTPGGPNNLLEAMFKNTIQAGSRVLNTANQVVNLVQTAISGSTQPITPQMNFDSREVAKSSGYYWIHSFGRTLDAYLEMKKTKGAKSARLCFCMYKDKMYYDCTLNSYSIRKIPGSLDYEYSIELTAWRRRAEPPYAGWRKPKQIASATKSYFNQIAALTEAIKKSRLLIAQSVDVLSGIRADVQETLMTPLRELSLLGRDIVQAGLDIYAFPQSLIASMHAQVIGTLKEMKISDPVKYSEISQTLASLGVYGTQSTESAPITNASAMPGALDSVAAEHQGTSAAQSNQFLAGGDPLNEMFGNPDKYAEVLSQLDPNDMQLSSAIRDKIDAEIDRVRSLTSVDFQLKRDKMQDFMASISEALGGGSTTHNRVNGLPAPKTVYRKLSVADIQLLSNLNDALMAVDTMVASMQQQQQQSSDDDYAAYYAEQARANGISFQENASKFLIPFPYDATLEQLAVQYLGDVNRWIEIAAINGLRPPYIDEVGFSYDFSSSGSGNSVVFDTAENLYVGQPVILSSDTQSPSHRVIKAIDVLSSVEVVITFDGDADLSRFTVTDNAKMKAYLPNTVNSLRLIAIPSSDPVNVPGKIQLTPGVQDIDTVALMAKRDFLLTSSGDIVMLGSGDVRVASGITNIVQAAKIKVLTPAGSILNDPTFGNPLQCGMPVSDMNAKDVLRTLQTVFADDLRFGPVLATRVQIQGPAASLDMLLSVNGTSLNLPFTTQLPV